MTTSHERERKEVGSNKKATKVVKKNKKYLVHDISFNQI